MVLALGRDKDLGELWILRDRTLERQSVTEVTAEVVETGTLSLPRSQLAEYVTVAGRRVWLAQVDLEARVEAEKVRALRHSAILGSLFRDDRSQNAIPIPFWVVLIILAVAVVLK